MIWVTSDESIAWHNLRVFAMEVKEDKGMLPKEIIYEL
jgi:hypothetical protein